ncbi:cytochrome c [Ramlibacter sp.]|uniref:c-type cytochrome n=1 Tax=Ramlibacter sp. TaxID=1917967 RepID=UPI0035AE0972
MSPSASLRRAALALALLTLSAAASAAPDADGPSLARQHCTVCHGAKGESTTEQFPQLAGQTREYLRKQLADFRAGTRVHVAMNQIAGGLTDAQMDALAQWFSQQTPELHPPRDALLAGVGRYIYERGNTFAGVPACVSCHSATGQGNARLPRLAGQHPLYVENQLRRFHAGARGNDGGVMGFVTGRLTELELRGVAAYVGGMSGGSRAASAR